MSPRASVVISRRGANRLRAGHPWVYRADVTTAEAEPGDLVRVLSDRRRPLGLAWWSSTSQIALRMLQGASAADQDPDSRSMLADRLRAALAYRAELHIDATAYRLVHAEADRLPGLIVDQYGDGTQVWLVVQTLCQATDRRLPAIVEALGQMLQPMGILARNDTRALSRCH